jgi:hypothetical protein
MNILNMTPEEAKAFIRKVMGPPKRRLEGKERENIWLLIKLTTPVRESNNQRFWTEEYLIGNRRYDVTYGLEDNPIIEVYENEIN